MRRHDSRTTAPQAWAILARTMVFAGCLMGASSCDRSPIEPSPSAPPGASGGAAPLTLRIEGPPQVAPGESPRYTAVEVYADGSEKDVTATAHWSPSSSQFAIHFTSPGVAAPAARGEAVVFASHAGKVARLHVLVLEPGTFKLIGTVASETGGGPLSGATVEILSGTGQGLRTTTAFNGGYNLYGVTGPVRVRASADRFTPQVHDLMVAAHDTSAVFTLAPVEVPLTVEGVWTMTVAPSTVCQPGLPDSARGRTYRVEIVQTGTHFKAAIPIATSGYKLEGLPGLVVGSRVNLLITGENSYDDGWGITSVYDRINGSEAFGFDGMVTGTLAGAAIRGTLDGHLAYWDGRPYPPTWHCRAGDQVVTLSR